MKPAGFAFLAAATRFYAPLIVLFALALLATRGPGGVGVIAGLAAGAAFALQAGVFGVLAAQRALAPPLARALLAAGLAVAAAGAAFPGCPRAPQLLEAGAFLLSVGASVLIVTVLFGRAPTLPEAES